MKTISTIQAWQGEADCKTCMIRDSVLFAGLNDDDFSHIHQPIDQFAVPAGGTLYHHNDRARYLYTVRHGLVKMVNYLPDGSQRIVRIARSTDVIGLEALVDEQYKHDAVILQDAEFCRLPVDVVKRLATENPDLHHELMKRWQGALNSANDWLVELSTGSARQRIARLLLMMGSNDEIHCDLMSREDMGSILGLTMETVSRIIAEFKRKGLVAKNDRGYYSCRLEKLDEIARG